MDEPSLPGSFVPRPGCRTRRLPPDLAPGTSDMLRRRELLETARPSAPTRAAGTSCVSRRRARYLGFDAPARIDVEHRIRILAAEMGLDPDEAVAEAQRILKESARGAVG